MGWMREQLVKELKKKISGISKWNPRKIPKWNLLAARCVLANQMYSHR
jgi:hypothetical protein